MHEQGLARVGGEALLVRDGGQAPMSGGVEGIEVGAARALVREDQDRAERRLGFGPRARDEPHVHS
jgi:hypothetical protein